MDRSLTFSWSLSRSNDRQVKHSAASDFNGEGEGGMGGCRGGWEVGVGGEVVESGRWGGGGGGGEWEVGVGGEVVESGRC